KGCEIETVMADVELGRDLPHIERELTPHVAAVELAARDDRIRIAELLSQERPRPIEIGPGMEANRERNRTRQQPVEGVGGSSGVIPPVRQDMVVAVACLRGPSPR